MKKTTKWLTAAMLSICSVFTCSGCVGGGSTQTPPMSIEDINNATKPKLYNFSAKVYDSSEFDTEDASNNNIKYSEYFDDAYMLVDPGASGEFINGFDGSVQQFSTLVNREVTTLATDITAKLQYVYGTRPGDSTTKITDSNLYGIYEIPNFDIAKTLTNGTIETTDLKFDLSNANHLSYIAQLNRGDSAPTQPVWNVMPLYFANAINGGYTYEYTIVNVSGVDSVQEGYSTNVNSSYAWAYAGQSNLQEMLKLNLTEVLAGYKLADLSSTYSDEAYNLALQNVDHLGIMKADQEAIKNFILNVVIGTSNIEYDTQCKDSFLSIINGVIVTDTTLGNVEAGDQQQIIVSGNLGFDHNEYIADTQNLYVQPFIMMHNYKAYEQVVDLIVSQATKLKFTNSTSVDVSPYNPFPRLHLLTVPMDILDGSTTTTLDDDNNTTYAPDIKNMDIKSIILRPKLVLANQKVSSHQYDMGFNLIGIEAVLYNEIGHNVDVYVTAEIKGNGVASTKENGDLYSFTESIEGGRYPSGSSDSSTGSTSQYPNNTYTELVDTELANTEWVGNQMLAFDGLDITTNEYTDIQEHKTEVHREGDDSVLIYTRYKLNTLSNIIGLGDLKLTNGDGSKYLAQGYAPIVDCGNNYLKLDFHQTYIADENGEDVTTMQKSVPLTILAINPDICFWIKGATDLIEDYVDK